MTVLRDAVPEDAAALARLGRESFCHAFEHLYRAEDLQPFLEQVYSEEAVAGEIADPGIRHQLTEDAPGTGISAFIKVNYESPYSEHSTARNPLCLGQLYTDPARTGQGLGAVLMDWCLDLARDRGCDAVQLSVYSDNPGAQRFYQRYGFAKIADIGFWVGEQRDHEFLYELRLPSV